MNPAGDFYGNDRLPEGLVVIVDIDPSDLDIQELAQIGILVRTPDQVKAKTLPANITFAWMSIDLDLPVTQKIRWELLRAGVQPTKIIRSRVRDTVLQRVRSLPNRPCFFESVPDVPEMSLTSALKKFANPRQTGSEQVEQLYLKFN